MKELLLYLGTFIVAYIFYFVFVLNRKDVLNKFPNGKEMSYLKYKYGVRITPNNLKKIANTICLTNSFILSTTVYVVSFFKELYLEVIVGMVTLIVLILGLYHIVGIYYRKKGDKHV